MIDEVLQLDYSSQDDVHSGDRLLVVILEGSDLMWAIYNEKQSLEELGLLLALKHKLGDLVQDRGGITYVVEELLCIVS